MRGGQALRGGAVLGQGASSQTSRPLLGRTASMAIAVKLPEPRQQPRAAALWPSVSDQADEVAWQDMEHWLEAVKFWGPFWIDQPGSRVPSRVTSVQVTYPSRHASSLKAAPGPPLTLLKHDADVDARELLDQIRSQFEHVVCAEAADNFFVFYNPNHVGSEQQMPFVTVMVNNANDDFSRLQQSGAYRVNVGVRRSVRCSTPRGVRLHGRRPTDATSGLRLLVLGLRGQPWPHDARTVAGAGRRGV